MGLLDYLLSSAPALRVRTWLIDSLYDGSGERERIETLSLLQEYSRGNQRPALPVKLGKPNDNVTLNLVGQIVNKSVAMLFGGEVEFDFGEDEAAAEYINEQWDGNRKPIFLHKLGRTGAETGTVYIEIVPDGYGEGKHRLISLNPRMMRIETAPEDIESVEKYVQVWAVEIDGKERMRRRIISRERTAEGADVGTWLVEKQEKGGVTQGRWTTIETLRWEYPFSPVLHGQNMPRDDSPYGESDIEDAIGLQDTINYIASNIKKIIRYHAHPKTIGKGFKADEGKAQDAGADVAIFGIPAEGDVYNLEMQSDLSSTRDYLNFLVKAIYGLTQTVDLNSIGDKLGQLTNFAVRVLYQDALEKLAVKRDLYGELLTEVNRRLLAINGEDYADTTGGSVVWPSEVMPQNEFEEAQAIRSDLEAGIVSRRTASIQRGYDWDGDEDEENGERALIEQDKASEDNVGAALVRAFNQGQ